MPGAAPVRLRLTLLLINLAAAAITVGAFLWLRSIVPPPDGGMGSLAGRLGFALRLAVWPSALLLAMVLAVAGSRAASGAFDPIADPESRLYRINQRVLSNTVEQTVIFLPLLLVLGARLGPNALNTLPILVALYVVARIVFWVGYRVHPYARAPGMAMTLTINLGVLSWLAFDALS